MAKEEKVIQVMSLDVQQDKFIHSIIKIGRSNGSKGLYWFHVLKLYPDQCKLYDLTKDVIIESMKKMAANGYIKDDRQTGYKYVKDLKFYTTGHQKEDESKKYSKPKWQVYIGVSIAIISFIVTSLITPHLKLFQFLIDLISF